MFGTIYRHTMKRHFACSTLLFLFLCTFFSALHAQNNTIRHEVTTGETLYSLSRLYGVAIEDIRAANPSLGATLLAGQVISIPRTQAAATAQPSTQPTTPTATQQPSHCKMMYLVEQKETVYGISRKFGVTEDELRHANPQIKKNKIKKGELLCIPYSAVELAAMSQREAERTRLLQEQKERQVEAERRKAQRINVALILPYGLSQSAKSNEAVKMIDFYEGFLLAVDKMKARGVSVNVHAIDEEDGSYRKIDSILAAPTTKQMDMIVGPLRADRIPTVSAFAKRNGIIHVVPFSTRTNLPAGAPTLFQVNTAVSVLHNKVYDMFMAEYPSAAVCFVNCDDRAYSTDFTAAFKRALAARGRSYTERTTADLASIDDIAPAGQSLVLIPSSNTQSALNALVHSLNGNSAETLARVSLFGYPDWQTFPARSQQDLQRFNASFFTTFHTQKNAADVQTFNSNFRRWFKRDQYNSYPLYGLLGYDIGVYFLSGISQFGAQFPSRQSDLHTPSIQNPMQFERSSADDGFRNTFISIVKL